MTHFIDISFTDAKIICRVTSTSLPGVGEFRTVSFRNVKLHLNNTGHRRIEVASLAPPSYLFRPCHTEKCWTLKKRA